MALSANILKDLIVANIAALPAESRDHEAVYLAIATAVVSHIQTSGQVVVASVSGVTVGPGVSGPGTGAIL